MKRGKKEQERRGKKKTFNTHSLSRDENCRGTAAAAMVLGGSGDEDEDEEGSSADAEAATLLRGQRGPTRSGSNGRRGREGAAAYADDDGDEAAAVARATTRNSGDDDASHRVLAERAAATAAPGLFPPALMPAFRPVPVQHGQECIVQLRGERTG